MLNKLTIALIVVSISLVVGAYYYGKSQAKVEYITKIVKVQDESQQDIKKVYEAVENEKKKFENVSEECKYVLDFDLRKCGL